MVRLLSNEWCQKVFSCFHLNINQNLKLKFIQHLKENEPLELITDIKVKNISLEDFPFFLFPNLKFIYLDQIQKINFFEELVKYCKNIQYISILDTNIKELSENIGNLNLLKILSCSSTNIQSIPECIGNCQLLQDLYLFDNPCLYSLPVSLKNCIRIKYISISNCNFYEFPKVLCELKNIVDLDISRNQINNIPDEISNLKELEFLKCNNTKIISLPESIKYCEKLKEFHAKFSYLEKLPLNIGDFKELSYLDLQGTKIRTLPDTIGNCSSLERLYLNYTSLENLPKSLVKLKKILEIFTDYTPFNQENQIIDLDISREGYFNIRGNYTVKFTSPFQNERDKKIEFLISQDNFYIPEKYKCNICYDIFKIPRTTMEGNTYCKDCILKWFSEKDTDPNINKKIKDKRIFPHYLFENELNLFIDDSYQKYFLHT